MIQRLKQRNKEPRDIVDTFEDTLNQKMEQLESKLESIIETKLGEKMNTEQCDTLNKASASYSGRVQGPSVSAGAQSLDFRQIMHETKKRRAGATTG